MPGSGKSTVGRQLARRLQTRFHDSDQAIELRIGCSIRQFFEQAGEPAFRDIESAVLQELMHMPGPGVLATGGGAVIRPENRACLRQAGTVVYLRVQPEDLFRRLRHDRDRPLLQVADPMGRLRDLFRQRDAFYEEVADITVGGEGHSIPELVGRILAQRDAARRGEGAIR